jgi:hypothetical protein
MTACVIMHNMIDKEEHNDNVYGQGWEFLGELVATIPNHRQTSQIFLHVHHELQDRATHNRLQEIWFTICEFMLEAISPFPLYFIWIQIIVINNA